jgi:ELWxxDGT repeat protein
MVADLNTTPFSSNPLYFTDAGAVTYFVAGSDESGQELWKSDGTAGGTVRLTDVSPGGNDSSVKEPTPSAGRVFFFANEPGFGRALYVNDGTPGGTVKLKSIGQESYGLDVGTRTLTDVNGTVFFTAGGDTSSTVVLWKSDGTPAGTVPVKSFPIPERGQSVSQLTAFNGKLYFTASDPAAGVELWKSDGTEAGTVRVKDINPGPLGSFPEHLTPFNGRLYFSAQGNAGGLWSTDGTEAGTTRQQSAYGSPAPGGQLLNLDGVLYVAGDGLWKSDGTAAGTVRVSDQQRGIYGKLVGSGGKVFLFTYDGGTPSWDLWVSDGTTAGTQVSLHLGTEDSPAYVEGPSIVSFGGAAYFLGDDGTGFGRELWRADGTPGGTGRLTDLMPGAGDGLTQFLSELAFAGGKLYFRGNDPVNGSEPWVSDGTAAGTHLLRDLWTYNAGSNPTDITDVDGIAFFMAMNGLWKSDGTAAGTQLLQTGGPNTPAQFVSAAGQLFFVGWDWELWRSNGTSEGTTALTALRPNSNRTLSGLTALQDRLMFFRFTGTDSELWGSDGTPGGTARVGSFIYNSFSTPVAVGGAAYFGAAGSGRPGYSLWKSDGTTAGTVAIKDLPSAPVGLTNVNGTLFFFADDPSAGWDLWKSDGTEAGTVKVKDIDPLVFWSSPTAVGNTFFFTADDGITGTELWKSDGTAAGTGLVKDIYPGSTGSQPNSSAPRYLVSSNGLLYFGAFEPEYGTEVWRSDGTDAGTVRVTDIAPGPGSSITYQLFEKLVDVNGTVYFVASDGGSNFELWQTNGTAAGTKQVQDLAGDGGSYVSEMGRVGDRLYFSANDRAHGTELWRTPPVSAASAAVVGRHVFYNNSKFDGNDGAANAADDAAIAPDKVALLPGQSPDFANVTSYDKGINGVMLDIANLPANTELTPADFEIAGGGRPLAVSVRRGAGANGSDRVTLSWPDYHPGVEFAPSAVANGWLTVTVKSGERTGLALPDVFSFGNLIGEADGAGGAGGWRVNALDLGAVKKALNSTAGLSATTDVNRDGRVNALDLGLIKRNLNRGLSQPAPAPAALFSEPKAAPSPRRPAGEIL